MSASTELIMESLDWDYAISPIFFLREQEKANIAWFQTYLENISKGFILSYNLTTREAWRFITQLGRGRNAEITLQGVYGFLTGSFHVPINWREMQLKVIFRHPGSLKEMEGFHPQVKICPNIAELIFPVTNNEETFVNLWNDALSSLRYGFTRL